MSASLEGIEVRISLELTGWFETPIPIAVRTVTVGSGLELNEYFSSRILSDTDGNGTIEPVPGPNGLLDGWLKVDISGNQVFAEFSGQAQPAGIKIRIENLAPNGVAPGTVQQAGAMNGVNIVYGPTYTAATKMLTLDWYLLGFQPGTVISQTVFYDNMLEDAPVAGNDNFAINVGQAFSTANILANDSDLDNGGPFGVVDILTVTHVNGQALDPNAWINLATGGQVKLSSSGQLEFREDGDFSDLARNVTRTTSFEYTVTDSTGKTDIGTVAIVVTGVNSAPVVSAPATIQLHENDSGVAISGLSISDPDNDQQSVTLSVDRGTLALASSAGLTATDLDGSDGTLSFSGSISAINTALAGVRYSASANDVGVATLTLATSDGSVSRSTTVSLEIADVDPVLAPVTASVAENSSNGTVVTTVVATGDTNGLVYSIVSGNEASAFSIDANTGVISVADSSKLDFETVTSFTLVVGVDDEDADTTLDDTTTVTIAVTDVNEAPTALSLTSQSINQSAGANAVVGSLSSVDADSTTFTYALVSGSGATDNDFFTISGTELVAKNPASLAAGTYSVRISTWDGELTFEAPFAITIVDDVAPVAPTVSLAAASDTGTSNSDGITMLSMPTLSGTAEANATIVVYANGTEVGQSLASGGGAWSFTFGTALAQGSHEITAKAKDAAGNISLLSSAATIQIDTAAPVAPTISSADRTNTITPIITGTAEAGAEIVLTIGGATYEFVANGPDWSVDLGTATPVSGAPSLDANGASSVVVTARDLAGNLSIAGTQTLTIDTSRPAVTAVAVPLDGTYKAGDRLEFTITADENVTVSGTPRLALLLDTGGVVHANYLSGSGSQNLVFAIALGAGLKDSDGIAITGLELNGGALRDAAGNALDLTLNNVASTAGILVDSIVPGGDPEPTIVDLGSATGPIVAGPGPENFQGTDNIDAVRFTGSRSDYRIDRNSDGSYTITGPGAPDTVNAIERLQFDDGILALDTDANPGLAFRLYQAAFDRDPDLAGLGFWIDLLDKGEIAPLQMAAHFIQSPEFTALYGDYRAMPADSFISLLYTNVLGREPDAEGFQFWQQAIGQGNSYDWLLSLFSESQENKDLIADFIAGGIWYEL